MKNDMNLIVFSVTYNQRYVNVLELALSSLKNNSQYDNNTTDVLIMTEPDFQPSVQKILNRLDISAKIFHISSKSVLHASASKLLFTKWSDIGKYRKILFLDTDVLLVGDLKKIFSLPIEDGKIYAKKEGYIGHPYWGGDRFFDFNIFDKDAPAFNCGVMLFYNGPKTVKMIDNIISNILKSTNMPECAEQPFIVYEFFKNEGYDISLLNTMIEMNPKNICPLVIIYHFNGGVGNSYIKMEKMINFLKLI
jgi:lipopolysaccharide biosynthesis glycosyltransferase